MESKVIHGDCREEMAKMPESSVDSIVTDPPYGLEFMGKEWDRLGNVGQGRSKKVKAAGIGQDFGDRIGRVSFNAEQNVRCGTCGHWRFIGTPCRCDEPDFPNVRSIQAREMQRWHESWATEAYRVLKPGGYLLAFGGSRTYHRLASAIEDAGFEVRDQIMWVYGSGFPKSRDIGKDFDRGNRKIVGIQEAPGLAKSNVAQGAQGRTHTTFPKYDIKPIGEMAKKWNGWGTSLKPAHEPICVARKPLVGTVAENVARFGTGALNIDGCRVGISTDTRRSNGKNQNSSSAFPHSDDSWKPHIESAGQIGKGRWPANLAHDGSEEVTSLFPHSKDGVAVKHNGVKSNGAVRMGRIGNYPPGTPDVGYGSEGSAARFFYCAKASKADRDDGCGSLEIRQTTGGGETTAAGSAYGSIKSPGHNHHPTVKPTDLMRWLCRLITPPGGTILDPFLGSGSTGKAAILEGFRFIGIEKSDEYIEIARARVLAAEKLASSKLL